ncbi:MAG: NAD(P)-dependent alcohol dehydrogenase [Proteobacteria bacterium]|nr:MAG: NAD(P)-dependent alcohol dehydrogenase [Pseudomonadota bacterium]
MKAIIYGTYGPPEVLHVSDVDKPVIGVDDVLIRVHAAEATKADCELRSFRFPVKWFWLPMRIGWGVSRPRNPVLGGYFSGTVEAVGRNASRLKVGDDVFGCAGLRMGAYGEYVRLPAGSTICPKPDNVSFEQAASIPLGGLNALHFLRRANIRRGETVLVNGAGGSIGLFAVQIAKSMGAEVTAVDHGRKETMLRGVGADRFIDYTKEQFARCGRSWDVILDMVVKSSYTDCVGSLTPTGRYLMGNPRLSDMARAIATTRLTGRTAIFAFARETQEELLALKAMVEEGKIAPVVDRVYAMEQAAEAHRRVETEQRSGSVVISLTGEST